MSISERILKLDALLDQLDAFAESHPEANTFWTRWFESLKSVSEIDGFRLLFDLEQAPRNREAMSLFQAGQISGEETATPSAHTESSTTKLLTGNWIAELHHRHRPISIEGSAEAHQQPDAFLEDPVTDGFLQVAAHYIDRTTASDANPTVRQSQHHLPLGLTEAVNQSQFIRLVTEDWSDQLHADRVSVFEVRGRTAKLLATTGHSRVIRPTDAIKALERTATEYLSGTWKTSSEGFDYHCPSDDAHSILLLIRSKTQRRELAIVQVQWASLTALMQNIESMMEIQNYVRAAGARLFNVQYANSLSKIVARRLIALLLAASGVTALWLCKDLETVRSINAAGHAHPLSQRIIYANCDGYVQYLAVEQDQWVSSGDLLITLRSPATELALQDLEGEIAAAIQHRAGLQVALNEARSEGSSSTGYAFQLAAEIAGLNARMAGLEKQRAILNRQLESYNLHCPISGTVISHDVRQTLTNKPVVAGEPLMRVADTAGQWQLSLDVDQRDILAVSAATEGKEGTLSNRAVTFRLVNDPTKIYLGTISRIENQVEFSDSGGAIGETEQVVRVTVSIKSEEISNLQIDSSVVAKIDCGSDKWWKNISRELLDALRRRFWIDV